MYNIMILVENQRLHNIIEKVIKKYNYNNIIEKVIKKYNYNMIVNDKNLSVLDVDLIIVDSFESCKNIRLINKTIPILMFIYNFTNYIRAIKLGADDAMYINKKNIRHSIIDLKIQSTIKILKNTEGIDSVSSIVKLLGKAIEAKDKYTEGHVERVSKLSVSIGQYMYLKVEDIRILEIGGYVHDIGKIGIPDNILNKNEKLTPDEQQIMRLHPVIGYDMISNISYLRPIKKIVRHHHEKLNGTGYPDSLLGKDIDLLTRIVAVVDIYDALVVDRPYRKALSKSETFNILDDMVELNEIDGNIVEILKNVVGH